MACAEQVILRRTGTLASCLCSGMFAAGVKSLFGDPWQSVKQSFCPAQESQLFCEGGGRALETPARGERGQLVPSISHLQNPRRQIFCPSRSSLFAKAFACSVVSRHGLLRASPAARRVLASSLTPVCLTKRVRSVGYLNLKGDPGSSWD